MPAWKLAAPLVAGAELNRAGIAERLDRGHLDATTLMEYLIRRGMPQRTAHGVVGGLVRKALDSGVRLSDLSVEEFKAADPSLDTSVYNVLGVEHAVGRVCQLWLDRAGTSGRTTTALETKTDFDFDRLGSFRADRCHPQFAFETPGLPCVSAIEISNWLLVLVACCAFSAALAMAAPLRAQDRR